MVLQDNTFKLFFASFFLLLGLTLLLSFGPIELSCTRINPNQVNCALVRSVAFGGLERDHVVLEPLKLAKLDTKIKYTDKNKNSVYDIVLVSDRDVLWVGGYDYNRAWDQAIVDQINDFLSDTNQTQLSLTDRNYEVDVLGCLMLGLSGVLFVIPFKDI